MLLFWYTKLMARRPLYEKDKAYKRNVHDTIAEKDAGFARLLDLKNHNQVEMRWASNGQMSDDGVFALKIGDKEAFLDAEQFRKFLRWV